MFGTITAFTKLLILLSLFYSFLFVIQTNTEMKKTFDTRLAAIDWIADFAEDEQQFEMLREQLLFNHIYTDTYFIDTSQFDDSDKARQKH